MATVDQEGLNCLPDEVLRKILEFMPLDSLLNCERVCQRWKNLVLDHVLWTRHQVVHSENPKQEQNTLQLIASHGEYISLLKLMYVERYITIQYILRRCRNVTSLTLVRCKLQQWFNTDLEKCVKLKKIDIQTCNLINESSDVHINFSNFENLSYIALSNFGLDFSNCDTLLQCRYLTHIYIEKNVYLELEFIRQLITCKQSILEALHIDGGKAVDDKCLQMLSKCTRLKDLAIAHCYSLTDKGLLALTNLRNLCRLKICNNSKCSEICLVSMLRSDNLKSLESLDLSGVKNVSSKVIAVIADCCTNIRCLTLYKCPKLVGCEQYLDIKLRNLTIALY